MNFRTGQLILIRKGRTLLTLWETRVAGSNRLTRRMIKFISENYKQRDLVGVEIGVSCADNAYSILKTLPIKRLYLIDPYYYTMYIKEGYDSSDQSQFDKVKNIAIREMSQFKDKVEFIFKKSEDAVDDVPDELDFVYIDGNHEYEYVKRDLEMYYPKVKVGGIFGGDNFESFYRSVARAVLEFTDKHGLKIYGGIAAAGSNQWWVIKK